MQLYLYETKPKLMMMQWSISSFQKRQSFITSVYVFQQYVYKKYSNKPGLQSTWDQNFYCSSMNFCLAVNHSEMIIYTNHWRKVLIMSENHFNLVMLRDWIIYSQLRRSIYFSKLYFKYFVGPSKWKLNETELIKNMVHHRTKGKLAVITSIKRNLVEVLQLTNLKH